MIDPKLQAALGIGADVSRRNVLKGGAAAAALFSLHGVGRASTPAASFDPEIFLLDRATFGLNEDMLNQVQTLGYDNFLQWQLDYDLIDDSAAEAIVSGFELGYPLWFDEHSGQPNPAKMTNTLGKTPAELFLQYPEETSGTTPLMMSVIAVMLRAIYSRRQLYYVMADFWQNVLNTYIAQERQHALWMPYVENVIYPHVLGNYGDMLKASAKHCSMMLYLGQFKSDKASPIENYARELMELHTVGVLNGSPFTEDDVEEASKVLTGWSMHALEDIADGFPNPDLYDCPSGTYTLFDYGDFVFRQERHQFGQKTVMGQVYGSQILPFPLPPCHGLEEGEQLIDDLVARDETAEHLSHRLIEWLIMDDPPAALVQRVASAFSSSGGEIRPMVKELFNSNFLHELRPAPNLKIRRPVNYVTAALRATAPTMTTGPLCSTSPPFFCLAGSSVATSIQWIGQLLKMGQLPGARPSPDGYPGANAEWASGLHPKLEFASKLGFTDDLGFELGVADLDRIFGATTAIADLAKTGSSYLFHLKHSVGDVRQVQLYIDSLATSLSYDDLRRECLAMLLSVPSYQYLH